MEIALASAYHYIVSDNHGRKDVGFNGSNIWKKNLDAPALKALLSMSPSICKFAVRCNTSDTAH